MNKSFGFSLVCILLSQVCNAQISASVTEGCAPLSAVQFNNGFNNPTNIIWDFDDGGGAAIPDPEHTFINSGVYNVSFSAVVNGSAVNETITITVNENPVADFSGEFGCVGSDIQLTDLSTSSSGTLADWEWTFGDGNFLNGEQNPIHVYGQPGNYTVGLIVTDENGCTGATIINDLITIAENPDVSIDNTPSLFSCEVPFDVTFTSNASSNSPNSNTLTYAWNFSNGNTSDAPNPPTQTYTETGSFPVSLTVTDDLGCSETVTQTVSTLNPEAAFTFLQNVNNDDTICLFNGFTNDSGLYPAIFDFGDGNGPQSFNQFTPHFYEFQSGGVYDISMTVGEGSCISTITETFVVQEPVFEISTSPDLSCETDFEIDILLSGNEAVDSISWIYSQQFIDTITGSGNNYIANVSYIDSINYEINGYLPIGVGGLVTTLQGCLASVSSVDSLWQPNAMPYSNFSNGCAPLTVMYADSSTSHPNQALLSWEWNINGETFINEGETIEYTFTEPGVYTSFLIVENSEGCIDTSYMDSIFVGEVLPLDFNFNPSPVCINDSITFEEITQNSNVEYWNFNGDGNSLEGCFLNSSQTVVFNDSTGIQPVTMTAIYNGCSTELTQNVEVLGAVGRLSYECNCDTPLDYAFNADVQNGSTWDWDFGDGTILTASTNTQEFHTYSQSGDYNAVLTTYSEDGCDPFVDTLVVKVRQLGGTVASDTLLCSGTPYMFQVNAIDNKVTCTRGYHMFWGDGTPPTMNNTGTFEHVFNFSGSPEVFAAIIDDNGCRDTIRPNIRVFQLEAFADADILTGCLPLDVNFNGTFDSDTTIANVSWDFGDETIGSESIISHQYNFPEPVNQFGQVIPWQAQYTITDAVGCSTADSINILPIVPTVQIQSTTDNTICVGDNTSFFPSVNNPDWTYEWDFGFETSNEPVPNITYNASGEFDVTLNIIDENGCPADAFQSSYISVENYPEAILTSTADELEVLCYPLQATFNNVSNYNGSEPGNIIWDLDNNSPVAPNNTVGFTYDEPGSYFINMEVLTANGCSDIAYDTLVVVGPVANLTTDIDLICKGETVVFNMIDTADVWVWQWDFGDGVVSDGVDFENNEEFSEIEHTYDFIPANGQVNATLTVWSLDSVCSFAYLETIDIYEVVAGFEVNGVDGDVEHCDDIFDSFTNTSMNADVFNWDLSVNGSSSANVPEIQDLPPGEHQVLLTVESAEFGCVDTISHNITIFSLPDVTAEGGLICPGEELVLNGSGAATYLWSPPDDLNNPQLQNPIATPLFTTFYTLTGTDTNSCSSTALALVEVFQPLPDFELDSTIIIGETISLELPPGNAGYNYIWSPENWVDCTTCPNVVLQPLEDINYTVTVSDTLGCFENDYFIQIEVLPLSSVAVPDVFTPNGDLINDIIYVDGWGIKNLLTFEIYNRWGELVFLTNDINEGWNGYYKGELQNMDSYSYIVKAETFIDPEPVEIFGVIMLKR